MKYTNKQTSFLLQANDRISNDPVTRLSAITKEVLQRKKFVFDAHCHVFDGDCINVKYLAIRTLDSIAENLKDKVWWLVTGKHLDEQKKTYTIEELTEELYEEPELIDEEKDVAIYIDELEARANQLEAEALIEKNKLQLLGLGEFLRRIRFIIRMIRSSDMEKVYKQFRDHYGIQNIVNRMDNSSPDLVTILLGMDLASGWEGRIKKSQAQQNKQLGALAEKYPVLPFLPIDPRREDMYDTFLDAFDKSQTSYFGVKCYPALGYLPSDIRLKPIFEICAKKHIPVLTHCGGESISTFVNPIRVNRNGIDEKITLRKRNARARFLNQPIEWATVLEEHEGLKLCFGHFGSGKAWAEPDSEYAARITIILDMMKAYNVYADFSFSLESSSARSQFIQKINQDNEWGDLIRNRTLFGTDFWVVLPKSDLNLDQHNFLNALGELKENLLITNVLNYLSIPAPNIIE